jgi:hypothetical protein
MLAPGLLAIVRLDHVANTLNGIPASGRRRITFCFAQANGHNQKQIPLLLPC